MTTPEPYVIDLAIREEIRHSLGRVVPDLSYDTTQAVAMFAMKLAQKLRLAEEKYHVSGEWMEQDWQVACQMHMLEHVFKGDPLDVAAYAMFMNHHGWPSYHRGGLVEYAEREFKILAELHPDHEDTGAWEDTAMKMRMLVGTLGSLGLSGGEAPYIRDMFEKLSNWIPLSPITGEESEWQDVTGQGGLDGSGRQWWQNQRLFSVFKDENGDVWETRGPILRYSNGCTVQATNYREQITLPYTPQPLETIDVNEDGTPKNPPAEAVVNKWVRDDIQITLDLNEAGVKVIAPVVEEWTDDQCLEAVVWLNKKSLADMGVETGEGNPMPTLLKEFV